MQSVPPGVRFYTDDEMASIADHATPGTYSDPRNKFRDMMLYIEHHYYHIVPPGIRNACWRRCGLPEAY